MTTLNILTASFLGLMSISSYAATIDGDISNHSEYQWNTDGAEGSDKWHSKLSSLTEYNDASGGDRYDIQYLGTNVSGGKFQFGVVGGEILDGQETGFGGGQAITLSDFAISINNPSADPTTSSAGFDFAIHLDSVVGSVANFSLLTGGTWDGTDLYGNPDHISDTFRMVGGTVVTTFQGVWSDNGGVDNVLEGEFDLSALLGLSGAGAIISTYLTMACVNDEALVHADVAAVPVPAALWLFAPALAGFMGLRRRAKTTV